MTTQLEMEAIVNSQFLEDNRLLSHKILDKTLILNYLI